MPYLTLAQFKLKTAIPAEFIDEIETIAPGWTAEQIAMESARLDARLAKRYATPFADPVPLIVPMWITRVVSLSAWLRRGVNATDEQFAEFKSQHDRALDEMKEAADSETGLFDLPLRSDTNASGISRGFPRAYSEQSPYVWRDQQREIGREEDSAKRGSSS